MITYFCALFGAGCLPSVLIAANLDPFILPSSNPLVGGPHANGSVYAMLVANGVVYVGGDFTSINGEVRNRVAALDARTGKLTQWNPDASGPVRSFAGSGTTLFVGGSFDRIGGKPRSSLAELDMVSGKASDWNPAVFESESGSPVVNVVLLAESQIVVGGRFSLIGANGRRNLVSIDRSTGALTFWAASIGGTIHAITASNRYFYVGAEELGRCLIAVDAVTGKTAYLDLDPDAESPNPIPFAVYALAQSDGKLFAAGSMYDSRSLPTPIQPTLLAAFDLSNHTRIWHREFVGVNLASFRSIAVSHGIVLVGGEAAYYGPGYADNFGLAAYSADTGANLEWNPHVWWFNQPEIGPFPTGSVYAIGVADGTVCVGGRFDYFGLLGTADRVPALKNLALFPPSGFSLLSVQSRTDQSVTVNLSAISQETCVLESSSDLRTWTAVTTNKLSRTPLAISERPSVFSPQKFFRARSIQ